LPLISENKTKMDRETRKFARIAIVLFTIFFAILASAATCYLIAAAYRILTGGV
jgi:hypothetical protein